MQLTITLDEVTATRLVEYAEDKSLTPRAAAADVVTRGLSALANRRAQAQRIHSGRTKAERTRVGRSGAEARWSKADE